MKTNIRIYERVNEVVTDPDYKKEAPEEQERPIRRVIDKARNRQRNETRRELEGVD